MLAEARSFEGLRLVHPPDGTPGKLTAFTQVVGASFTVARPQPDGRGSEMKTFLLAPMLVTCLALTGAATLPARAGGGDLGAGLIGGLAVGTIIGAAATAPRYYPPPPVYVAPASYCYWTRGEPLWDGYRGVWTYPSVRVCE
jgi:hypothetical protein